MFLSTHIYKYVISLKKLLNHFSNYFNKMESKPNLAYSEYKRILNKLYYKFSNFV